MAYDLVIIIGKDLPGILGRLTAKAKTLGIAGKVLFIGDGMTSTKDLDLSKLDSGNVHDRTIFVDFSHGGDRLDEELKVQRHTLDGGITSEALVDKIFHHIQAEESDTEPAKINFMQFSCHGGLAPKRKEFNKDQVKFYLVRASAKHETLTEQNAEAIETIMELVKANVPCEAIGHYLISQDPETYRLFHNDKYHKFSRAAKLTPDKIEKALEALKEEEQEKVKELILNLKKPPAKADYSFGGLVKRFPEINQSRYKEIRTKLEKEFDDAVTTENIIEYTKKRIAGILPEAKLPKDFQSSFGENPQEKLLLTAMMRQTNDVVFRILDKNPELLKSSSNLLCRAVDYANKEMVEYFIKQGLSLTARDKNGKSPMEYATTPKHGAIKEILAKALERQEYNNLLQAMSDPRKFTNGEIAARQQLSELLNSSGTTFLMLAAANGNVAMMELLIKNVGADISRKNSKHEKAIDLALKNEQPGAIIKLLENGEYILSLGPRILKALSAPKFITDKNREDWVSLEQLFQDAREVNRLMSMIENAKDEAKGQTADKDLAPEIQAQIVILLQRNIKHLIVFDYLRPLDPKIPDYIKKQLATVESKEEITGSSAPKSASTTLAPASFAEDSKQEWHQTSEWETIPALLLQAIKDHKVEMVKTILTTNPGLINATDKNGATLLHLVTQAEDLELIVFLLLNNASITIQNKSGICPFHYASEMQTRDLIIKEGLRRAIAENNLEEIEKIITTSKININYIFMPENTNALLMAVELGKDQVVKMLLEKYKAQPNSIKSILHKAVIKGHIPTVKTLLQHLSPKQISEEDPLKIALINNQEQLAISLIQDMPSINPAYVRIALAENMPKVVIAMCKTKINILDLAKDIRTSEPKDADKNTDWIDLLALLKDAELLQTYKKKFVNKIDDKALNQIIEIMRSAKGNQGVYDIINTTLPPESQTTLNYCVKNVTPKTAQLLSDMLPLFLNHTSEEVRNEALDTAIKRLLKYPEQPAFREIAGKIIIQNMKAALRKDSSRVINVQELIPWPKKPIAKPEVVTALINYVNNHFDVKKGPQDKKEPSTSLAPSKSAPAKVQNKDSQAEQK